MAPKPQAAAADVDDDFEDESENKGLIAGAPKGALDAADAPVVKLRIGSRKGDIALLSALCSSVFFSGCLTSVLAPILPQHLAELKGSALLKGAIFGAYPITVALVSLWVPQLSKRWGRLPTLLWGIVVEGALVIVFGFVQNFMHKARDGATLWVYLLLRVGMGVGEATQSTMLLAYATDHFGSTGALGSVMGWQETCAGVGFIVGPAMGGLLDQVGGFYLPFLVIGLMILSLLAIMPFALVGQRNGLIVAAEGASNLSYRDFMNFDVMNAAAATTLMGIAFGSIMPTLAPHLEQRLKLRDAAHVGIAYIIPALVYGIACPLVGEISDRMGYRRVIIFGFSLLTFAFVMMGPIPPLAAVCGLRGPKAAGSLKAWIWAVIAMVFFGIGGACAFVPTLPAMERGSRNLGPAGSEAISGAYWTLYFLGEGIGPFVGTFLVKSFGSGWGFGGVALMLGSFVALSRFYGARAAPEPALGDAHAPAGGAAGTELELGVLPARTGGIEDQSLLPNS